VRRASTAAEAIRVHVIVRGRVQGVGFRYSMIARARSLGVGGWVRNRSDGSVEAVFEGPAERVESMVDWCRRGPSGARVDSVEEAAEAAHGEREFVHHPGG
jgi:acylphosphatase